jgi:general secretion pathway protein H
VRPDSDIRAQCARPSGASAGIARRGFAAGSAGAHAPWSNEAGFTFLEILLVIGIIAVAATLVAPAIDSGMRAREVRSAVRGVAATLKTMQSDAVISGKVQHLVIDPQENQLRVEDRDASYTLGQSTQMTRVRGGEVGPAGLVRVNFYPNGSTSGVDDVIDDRDSPGDQGFLVSLDPLIGVVTIEDEPQRW